MVVIKLLRGIVSRLFPSARHGVGIGGNVLFIVRDVETGEEQRIRCANRVVDDGLNHARDLFGGHGLRPNEIAVGTGTTAAVAGDSALETEVFRMDIHRRTRSEKTIGFHGLILTSEANGYTLSEAGLFQDSTMIARAVLSPAIVKTVSKEVTIVHELEFSNV